MPAIKDIALELSEYELGIRETVDEAAKDAKKAFKIYRDADFSLRKKIIGNIRIVLSQHNEILARMAVEETGLGRVQDKTLKNRLLIEKTPGIDRRKYKPDSAYLLDYGIPFLRKAPFGVIGSVTPSTNPAATIIMSSISMLSAGNVIVFNAHPAAKDVSNMAAMLVNKAIREAGCQASLVFSIKNPTIETSQQLMKHPDIKLLVVTGGSDAVRAAISLGKKVIAEGPGNPPVIVDETADIERAAECIVKGASFENNILCIAEKEVFVVDRVADNLKNQMRKHNAYELSALELAKITDMVFVEGEGVKAVNKKYVGKDATIIARDAGIIVPPKTRLLFGETDFSHPLVQYEQLMPVLPIVRIDDWKQAMDYALQAEHGYRHTSIMHSSNTDRLAAAAKRLNTALFVKNKDSLSTLDY